MDELSKSGKIDIARARPAATLILVREREGQPPELLMVERSSKMRFAGGAAVFPGGGVDADDIEHAARLMQADGVLLLESADAAARIAAIRETLEETGLAYAIAGVSSGAEIKEARVRLHDGALFSSLCAEYGWQLVLEGLIPWSRWCPPTHIQPVYDTRFYLGDGNRIAAHGWADATENVGLFWQDADTILRRAEAGELSVIFPTHRNLERLARHGGFDALRAHAEEYPARLVETYVEERAEGRFLCIPDGHGYPILEQNMDAVKRG